MFNSFRPHIKQSHKKHLMRLNLIKNFQKLNNFFTINIAIMKANTVLSNNADHCGTAFGSYSFSTKHSLATPSQFLEVQRSGQNKDLEGQVERSIADNMHLLHKILYSDYVQAKQNCLLKA